MKNLNDNERKMYFLLLCIPIRYIIAYSPTYVSKQHLKYLGVVFLLIGISFMYLYVCKLRMDAPEGGGKTWWAEYRIVHSLLYLVAGAMAIKGDRRAWIPLAVDATTGLLLFVNREYLK